MSEYVLVRLSEISKKQIAKFGNMNVIENEYELEKAKMDNKGVLRLERRNLYVLGDGIFISLNDASVQTGLSAKVLLVLCKKGILYAKKSGKNYVISLASLEALMRLIP